MLALPRRPLFSDRLVMRPIEASHAAAFWSLLRDPELAWIAQKPPRSEADVEARFARIAERTAPGRAEEWLNWTVWTRDEERPLGIVEATVPASNDVLIAYMFGPEARGLGYATEAVAVCLEAMRIAGARSFTATIDIRNAPSLRLVRRLGFRCIERRASEDIVAGAPGEEEVWRLDS